MTQHNSPLLRRPLAVAGATELPDIHKGRLGGIVGAHPAMTKVFEQILLWAPTAANIVIAGETGVGKELVAHAIHDFSPRARKPFVVLDCSTLAKELLESELFGHEKGSFTGASGLHLGRFERANSGTLFLDEISNMNMEVQSKLLRVLQSRAFERIGGNREIKIDVRVVAASNKSLRDCVDQGTFREDLFHRLNTGVIEVPPLRERASDIPLLAREFLNAFKSQYLKEIDNFTPEAFAVLTRYPWPGNVRELRNVAERAVILTRDSLIDVSSLPPHVIDPREASSQSDHRPLARNIPFLERIQKKPATRSMNSYRSIVASSTPKPQTPPVPEVSDAELAKGDMEDPLNGVDCDTRLFKEVANHEKQVIFKTLRDFNGNVVRASAYLGVSRTTLYKKMQKHGIDIDSIRV